MKKMKADNKTILKGERGYRKLVPNTKAEERKMDWELTSVSHGSHDDSHDSLARCLSRPIFYHGLFFHFWPAQVASKSSDELGTRKRK